MTDVARRAAELVLEPAAVITGGWPPGMPADDFATSNRLEPQMAMVLAGAQGIKSLVNTLADADAARSAHVAAGFGMLDVWSKQRVWLLPSGEELLVAFRVLLPEPGQVPLMFNGVEYRTLHHYLRPEFRRHRNGARRWVSVSAVVDDEDFDEAVAIYERYGTAAMRGPGEATIAVRDTSLRLMTSGAWPLPSARWTCPDSNHPPTAPSSSR